MRNYNQMFVVGFIVFLFCSSSVGGELGESDSLRLDIKADKDVYGPDEPIHIDLRITNTRETDLGPGKSHLTGKDDSLYVFIPKKIYVAVVMKDNDHFELSAGSFALDDKTMEKVMTGKLEPLEKWDFVSIPPGYFYGRRFNIPAEANIRGQITCTYSNKFYSGEKDGIAAWRGTIKSNILNIRVEGKKKTSENEDLE